MPELRTIVEDFTNQLSTLIESQVMERARAAVTAALGNGTAHGRRGRPPKALQFGMATELRIRRKGPKQLCPVPGCKNPAAPVFGMVCAKHKDVPKAKIKLFRELRRARKLKARRGAPGKASAAA
jgi:hypothetical protein